MTFQELYQLLNLKKEIEEQKERLQLLKEQAGSISCNITGAPAFGFCGDRVGKIAVESAMVESIIQSQIAEYLRIYRELETYINTISDSFIRRIFRMRFIDGLTWGKIALKSEGKYNADSIRMVAVRYLDKK